MGSRLLHVLGPLVVGAALLLPAGVRADGAARSPRTLDLQLPTLTLAATSQPASQPAVPLAAPLAPARAAPQPPVPPAGPRPMSRGAWGRYRDFWNQELTRLLAMDLWGATTQLPKGYLTVKYQFNYRKAAGRFDGDGKKVRMIPPITFGGILNEGQPNEINRPCLAADYSDCLLAFDAGAEGFGGSHEVMVSYGVTGRLDWYVQVPMQFHTVHFRPRLLAIDPFFATATAISDALDRQSVNDFFTMIKRLGRPAPNEDAHVALTLGDVNTGFSWNFFRNKWVSTAVTYRLYFPTGHVADPDNALAFFTGPDIDAGNHAFALGAGLGHDFRLPHFIHKNIDLGFYLEWNFAYAFPWERPYPSTCSTVYDRTQPADSENNRCRGFRPREDAAAQLFDPQGIYFPDLSNMRANGATYTYTPGFSMDLSATLSLNLWGLGLGVGVGQSFAQKPEFDADPAFLQMVDGLQLVAPTRATVMKVAVQIPLFMLYLPASLTFQYQHDLAGRNTLYFRNNFYVTLQGFIPDEYLLKRGRR
jgi:hypothetical protein